MICRFYLVSPTQEDIKMEEVKGNFAQILLPESDMHCLETWMEGSFPKVCEKAHGRLLEFPNLWLLIVKTMKINVNSVRFGFLWMYTLGSLRHLCMLLVAYIKVSITTPKHRSCCEGRRQHFHIVGWNSSFMGQNMVFWPS